MAKQRNSSIDIFRYICAVLIVIIHTSLFSDVNGKLSYIFVSILPRVAVPFFFAVAGYFYIGKLEQGKKAFAPYIKKILLTYVIWSVIYFIWDFIQWGHTGLKGFAVNCVRTFIVDGSHYHLWFFVALIFSVCVVTLAYKLKLQKLLIPISILLYLIGCLGCSYYGLGEKIPLLSKIFDSSYFVILRHYLFMGLPFFVLGQAVAKLQSKFSAFSNKKYCLMLLSAVAIWALEIVAVILLKVQRDVVLTIGLYPLTATVLLFLLRNPMPKWESKATLCRTVANLTYYAHPLFIEVLGRFFNITPTLLCVTVVAVTAALGFVIFKINNKYLNKLVF